jgi:hypothetical protein
MAPDAAVRIHDDLAAREARVGVGAALHEPARRVDVVLRLRVEEPRRDRRPDHLLDDLLAELLDLHPGVMLGGDDHRRDARRPLPLILHRDLRLPVGADVGEDLLPPHLRQPQDEAVGERDRQRHQLLGLVAGVAEHEALIPGAPGVDAQGDVG